MMALLRAGSPMSAPQARLARQAHAAGGPAAACRRAHIQIVATAGQLLALVRSSTI